MEVKEVKEAIMFLENTLYFCIGEEDDMPDYQSKYNHWIKKTINLLQQGEAYRLILKALDKNYGHYLIGVKDNGEVGESYTIRNLIDISYQKYFPKEEVKTNGS